MLSHFVFLFDWRRRIKSTHWLKVLLLVFLLALAIAGVIFARSRYIGAAPIEISIARPEISSGTVYVGGAVAVPGLYPFGPGDTVIDIIDAAGNIIGRSDLKALKLYIPVSDEARSQRVDINRAEPWLLQALPGIGETLAQRIVDYRQQNGPFADTIDLISVSGIGKAGYNRIKDLITVADY